MECRGGAGPARAGETGGDFPKERTGQSSLPHVFVGGQSIGGLYSGTPGLAALQQQDELRDLLQEAGAFS
jgi:hypothetical protein